MFRGVVWPSWNADLPGTPGTRPCFHGRNGERLGGVLEERAKCTGSVFFS